MALMDHTIRHTRRVLRGHGLNQLPHSRKRRTSTVVAVSLNSQISGPKVRVLVRPPCFQRLRVDGGVSSKPAGISSIGQRLKRPRVSRFRRHLPSRELAKSLAICPPDVNSTGRLSRRPVSPRPSPLAGF